MHERDGDYPRDRRSTRAWAATRYALAWLAATAALVAVLAAALNTPGERRPALAVAVERAACRIEAQDSAPSTGTGAAVEAGSVVLRYRATLDRSESAILQRIARRLAQRALTVPQALRGAAVEVKSDDRRLRCPRLDRRAERAIILFSLRWDRRP